MTAAKIALLEDRGVISVAGEDAYKFLQGLITNDVDLWPWLKQAPVPPEMGGLIIPRGAYAALLSPQGKILFDVIVRRVDDREPSGGYFLDVAALKVAELIQRLSMYRLRADVKIADESTRFSTYAVWGGDERRFNHWDAIPDPRLPALGQRILWPTRPDPERLAETFKVYGSTSDGSSPIAGLEKLQQLGWVPEPASSVDYHAHRISFGVPEGGLDYAWGDVFPHEAMLDQFSGVSFTKGCYVGQEIVARMEHRGTARRRIIRVTGTARLPAMGTDILAGDVVIGTMGSSHETAGLALLRLDRVAEFAAKGIHLTTSGIHIVPDQADMARLMPQSPGALDPK